MTIASDIEDISFLHWVAGRSKLGPQIGLSLPSFSGRTADEPEMLRYVCRLSTNARLTKPLKLAFQRQPDDEGNLEGMEAILGGRPVVTIAFDNMTMVVQQPVPVLEKLDKAHWQVQEANGANALVCDSKRMMLVS